VKVLKKVLAGASAAVGVIAIGLAAALPASAAPAAPARHAVNYEWISGSLTGPGALANAPVVPLRLTGAVNTWGNINLGGNSAVSGIWTAKGTLTVLHGNPNPPPRLNYQSCRVTYTISTSYKVLGNQSSGAFRKAQGNGRAVVVFSWIAPRNTFGKYKGQCNFSPKAKPLPYGARITFNAQGPLYVWH
jgi:hypothetical protein